jgi:hypothetical protein
MSQKTKNKIRQKKKKKKALKMGWKIDSKSHLEPVSMLLDLA